MFDKGHSSRARPARFANHARPWRPAGAAAPIGTTDEDRIRHLTVALPPRYAARLFDAQEQGASEQQLRKITAEGLKEVYFQDDGRRAGQLEEVRFTDIEHLEFDL